MNPLQRSWMAGIYFLIEGQPKGPYLEADVRQYLAEGRITNDQLAWREGLAEWMPISNILQSILQPPPLPVKAPNQTDFQGKPRPTEDNLSADAQNRLGKRYNQGKVVKRGLRTWFQNWMGDRYYQGNWVKQDYRKAFICYLKTANQGHVVAQYTIGCMYENGYGVAQDYSQAFSWYKKAANQGLAVAQNNINAMYHNGRGVSAPPVPRRVPRRTVWSEFKQVLKVLFWIFVILTSPVWIVIVGVLMYLLWPIVGAIGICMACGEIGRKINSR